MVESIDVHDLPDDQAHLVQEFVAFLRGKLHTQQVKEAEAQDQAWGTAAITSFAKDWDNPSDARYDNWKELYHVQKG